MTSILEDSLEPTKAKIDRERIKRLENNIDSIRLKKDRQHVLRMARGLREQGTRFEIRSNDATWLAQIECRLGSNGTWRHLQDQLVEKAEVIVRNGGLESGKCQRLSNLVDKAHLKLLPWSEFDDLQSLVHMAG